ncbi:ricin-type beta-trefoil lectin domain protein [Actinoplanes sp. CA-015351]|uniref:ricin-type beta-trefoil lectin domain protein n=1 Tax=Actinoplanes sp. CA-015351 TaxID=3239897 RepID=UPI003D97EAAC
MGSTGEDGNDAREPLLVRPFVLQDDDPQETSTETWPADPTREIPTQLIPTVPSPAPGGPKPPGRRRRRPLLLVGAGAAAVLAIAGYAVLRPVNQPAVPTSLPGQGLPVVTGPAPSTEAATDSNAGGIGDGTAAGNGTAGNGTARNGTAGNGQGDGDQTDQSGATGTTGPGGTRTTSPLSTTQPAAPTATTTATTTAPAATITTVPPADLVPPDPLLTAQGALTSRNGLCLDLRGGDAAEGREVHVDDCNGTSPQRWQLRADKTLEVLDMCAYLVGDGTVELTGCDTRTTAQWTLDENGRLTNAANGQCLTDPYFGARPGNQVIVTRCTGANNQQWSFR